MFILLNQGKEVTHFKKTFIKTLKIFQILHLLIQIFRTLKLPKITQATGIFQIIRKIPTQLNQTTVQLYDLKKREK